MPLELSSASLLCLLQLTSPALPIGAYSYSEGLETLVDSGTINDRHSLEHWLNQELRYGAIRLETAVMARTFRGASMGDLEALSYWNAWLSAARETEELRHQSWQMGNSLLRLAQDIQPPHSPGKGGFCTKVTGEPQELSAKPAPTQGLAACGLVTLANACGSPCNLACAFGLVAAYWQIDLLAASLGYLHSWAFNLINAGVKLIPLGQTAGQQLLLNLHPTLTHVAQEILTLDDDNLNTCGWGLALASMAHEVQYTRLFRS
jgi:urease accessory protein